MNFSKNMSRRLIISVTTVILVGSILWVQWFSRSNARSDSSPPASIQEIVDAQTLEPADGIAHSDVTASETAETTDPTLDPTPKESVAAEPKIVSLLEEIKIGLKQQNDSCLYFDERLQPIDAILPKLESVIALQSAVAKRLDERMLNLEGQVLQLAATLDRPESSADSADGVPPFRLIAIDRWNNEWNAVIELDGKISMIGPHLSRAGWLLLEVDPDNRSALFQARSGRKVRIKVSG